VRLDDIFGGVDVDNQNGTVEVSVLPAKNPSGACNAVNLRTSFSPLRIYLDDSAKYDVTARYFRKSFQRTANHDDWNYRRRRSEWKNKWWRLPAPTNE